MPSQVRSTGLEVLDLQSDREFAERPSRARNVALQIEGLHGLLRAFVLDPDTLLQELVNSAVDLCGADSAGISIELADKNDAHFYQWVAIAGEYAGFLNAMLPRFPSACGLCLERGRPQLFRVSQPFFELMGMEAALVTDGILLPWQVAEIRGTIWIMAHGRAEAFDADDCRIMQVLAGFVGMGVAHQQRQKLLMKQVRAAAAVAMANDLAHTINNPLQIVTNILYLASKGESGGDAKTLAQDLSGPIERLSVLVRNELSAVFTQEIRST